MYLSAVRQLLADAVGHVIKEHKSKAILPLEQIQAEHPASEKHGDYASAVAFTLAKLLERTPAETAAEIAEHINTHADHHSVILNGHKQSALSVVDRAVAAGPYVNLWLAPVALEKILQDVSEYKKPKVATGAPIVVEYSSVNIGKPFSIGHLRSTVNGDAIANLLEATGHKVVRMNYLGDWGTQFGKLIVGWQRWGDQTALASDSIKELMRVYVKFHEEAAKPAGKELLEEARIWFRKLEQDDPEARTLWEKFRAATLEHAQEIYKLLDVKFDEVSGESQYKDALPDLLELLRKKGLLKKSQGAEIVDLEAEKLPPLLLVKRDEGSLYATRELAAAIDRFKRYKFDRMLYEVGIEQELHFRQVFATLKKLDFDWADNLEHIAHNLYAIGGKKMSTRAGRVSDMKEVLDEAIARADKVIAAKNPELKNRAKIARQVGIGAVKYHDLSQNRLTRIEFDFDRMLSLEGNSAPYLQYTHARICSVLAKAGRIKTGSIKLKQAEGPEEILLRRLVRYEEAVILAAERRMPHLLAAELYELAARFNVFYAKLPILKADEPVRTERLRLSAAVARLLERGLGLLGIEAPSEM